MADTARDEITRLEQEFEKDPEGRLFVHLAEAYRKSGELERALDLLEQGLEQHGDSVSARLVLAQVHAEMGNGENARAVWEAVVRQDGEYDDEPGHGRVEAGCRSGTLPPRSAKVEPAHPAADLAKAGGRR